MTTAHLMSPVFITGEKKDLPDSHLNNKIVILPISIGQTASTGDKGTATLRLMAKNPSQMTYIIPADTLQRHNLVAENNLDDNSAQNMAKQRGADWNAWFVSQQTEPQKTISNYQMLDWDYWRNHENYKETEAAIERIFKTNEQNFRDVVKTTAVDFIKEKAKTENFDEKVNQFLKASIDYLKEEVVVTLLWIRELQRLHPNVPIVQLYPKDPNPVLVHLYKKLLTAQEKKFFNFVTIHCGDKKFTHTSNSIEVTSTSSSNSNSNSSHNSGGSETGSPPSDGYFQSLIEQQKLQMEQQRLQMEQHKLQMEQQIEQQKLQMEQQRLQQEAFVNQQQLLVKMMEEHGKVLDTLRQIMPQQQTDREIVFRPLGLTPMYSSTQQSQQVPSSLSSTILSDKNENGGPAHIFN